jgi:asparagine synthase (glutamine-hydrolysing)
MCGIAGLVKLKHASVDRDLLWRMLEAMAHRGPDDSGVFVKSNVGLAHSRLSIIDLDGGHQPMSIENGSLWITFNGEIFNYVELREELEKRGHHFTTRSDTEVVLRMYLEKGEECVHSFNGQWAFAIWDAREQKLFLSRDRYGVRPLFYTILGDDFIFASEIKALLANPTVKREIDLLGLDQIFTFWVTVAPRTAFKDILQLPPGHSLALQEGRVAIRQYWAPEYVSEEELTLDSPGQKAEELLALMEDATRIRLRSDVPVGAYLSGGIDSTFTTALITRFAQERLRTFSVAFEDSTFDESSYQREASDFLHTKHSEIRCSAEDIGTIFPDVVWHTEQPITRTAPAPLYLLSRLVRESGFKVVLTGEGADEILGGYDIFKESKIRRFWGKDISSRFRPLLLRRLYPYMENIQRQPEAYLRAFFHVTHEDLGNPFFSHLPRWELTAHLKMFFSNTVKAELRESDTVAELEQELPRCYSRWSAFCQAQYLEAKYLLPGYILSSQGDRMAMAHSVEGRYPFLDHRVTEFAARLHPSLKMRVLNEKYLLKEAARGKVPASICKRTKQPYRAPDGMCFFTKQSPDYVADLLSSDGLKKNDLFQESAVTKLVAKFRSGHTTSTKDNMALVGILSTQLLAAKFLDTTRATPIRMRGVPA